MVTGGTETAPHARMPSREYLEAIDKANKKQVEEVTAQTLCHASVGYGYTGIFMWKRLIIFQCTGGGIAKLPQAAQQAAVGRGGVL